MKYIHMVFSKKSGGYYLEGVFSSAEKAYEHKTKLVQRGIEAIVRKELLNSGLGFKIDDEKRWKVELEGGER